MNSTSTPFLTGERDRYEALCDAARRHGISAIRYSQRGFVRYCLKGGGHSFYPRDTGKLASLSSCEAYLRDLEG